MGNVNKCILAINVKTATEFRPIGVLYAVILHK